MTKELLTYVTQKTEEMVKSPSCCPEIKVAAQAWLDAIGTPNETAQTQQYMKDLESVILPVNSMVGFLSSDSGVHFFGAERAGKMLAHARALQVSGIKFCDCPACSAAEAILARKSELLAK